MSPNSSHQNSRRRASWRTGVRTRIIPLFASCGWVVCACCLIAVDQTSSAEPVKLVPRAIPGMSPAQINAPKVMPARVVKAPAAAVTSGETARVLTIRRHHQLPDSQKLKKSEPMLILPNEDKNPVPPAAPPLQDGKVRIIPKEQVPSLKVQKDEQQKKPTPAK